MQVDISSVLAIVSTVLTVAFGAWLATARYALANRDGEINRRIDAVTNDTKGIDARLHTEEKATIRQDGEIARVRDTHENLSADLTEIKRSMVTKTEWHSLERTIERRFDEMARNRLTDESRREYQRRLTPGAYSGVGTTGSPPPPRPDKK